MIISLSIVATLCLVTAVIYWLSHRLLFKPDRFTTPHAPAFTTDMRFEDVQFESVDGLRLHGWHCHRPENTTTLLLCHGNKGSLRGRENTVDFYARLGMNVFAFDYRGYGLSEGRPNEKGSYRDVRAAWDYLRGQKLIAAKNIVILGRSLGGAIAADLLADSSIAEMPGAAILESTFTSVPELAVELYPITGRLIGLFIRYNSLKKVGSIRTPLLLIHSSEDELIGIHHGKSLLSCSPPGTRWLEIKGQHRDGFVTSQSMYYPAIRKFLLANGLALNSDQADFNQARQLKTKIEQP